MTETRQPRVLSVGQCSPDHGSLSRMLAQAAGAHVEPVAGHDKALQAVRDGGYALVLVNRIGDADGASGLDLIRQLQSDPATRNVAVMLVSNFPDAQKEAVSLGAQLGFGKDALGSEQLIARMSSILGN